MIVINYMNVIVANVASFTSRMVCLGHCVSGTLQFKACSQLVSWLCPVQYLAIHCILVIDKFVHYGYNVIILHKVSLVWSVFYFKNSCHGNTDGGQRLSTILLHFSDI